MPEEKLLLETDRFQVVRARKLETDGGRIEREVIRHPGAVVILPRIKPDRVCLIRNYRISLDKTLIELPAGTLNPGEDPRQCAIRELREETGLIAEDFKLVQTFYVSPGILDERMYLYVADRLTEGPPEREEYERIENLVVPLTEAMAMVRSGEICDAKTIIGLMLCEQGVMD